MYIDRILYPISTLGPGNRLVIWTKGCKKHCKNCANPELWNIGNSINISVDEISKIIVNIHRENPIDGITISGGDPLEQVDELIHLLEKLQDITDDILVYTGFQYSELRRTWDKNIINKLEDNIGVLIDGPYIEELNDDSLTLSGSKNQNIIYFNKRLEDSYEEYIKQGRKIQNVYMGNRLISVGMHGGRNEKT